MNTEQKRPRGRPRDATKCQSILDAARTLFLERGLEVTTEEIAAKAGVAKATIYGWFTDKESLVEAVIRRESDLTISDEQFIESRSLPLNEVLQAFGLRYIRFINNRELHGWDRLIASAAVKSPELPARFFKAGPGRGQEMLVSVIKQAIDRGELSVCDPQQAADDLSGIWLGFTHLAIKLGVRKALTSEEIESRVNHGISVFMAFYGPR